MNGMKGDDAHMYINGTCCICAVHHTWGLAKEPCVRASLTPGAYKVERAKYRRRKATMRPDAAE